MPEPARPRTAVITGGSGGIGLATGALLHERGYDVVLVARDRDRLRDAAETVGARWHCVDCTDEAATRAAAETLGPVDLVVHAAGMLEARRSRRQTHAAFDKIVQANLAGAYVVATAFAPRLPPGSRLIFLASTAAVDGGAFLSAYAASKGAVRMLAATMRAELEPEGIAVHVLMPGTVDTAMMGVTEMTRASLAPADIASAVAWLDSLPLRARVDEIVMRPAETSPFAHFIHPIMSTEDGTS